MARKPRYVTLEAIYNKVHQNPRKKPETIAQLLGLERSQVTRSLPALNQAGLLLYEDDQGGLWPFTKTK